MAAIAIVLSSAVGFLMGLVQFAFMNASLWQAFMTYIGASASLAVIAIGASMLIARFSGDTGRHEVRPPDLASPGTLENWHDWQAEEEIESDRLMTGIKMVEQHGARSRKSAMRRSA